MCTNGMTFTVRCREIKKCIKTMKTTSRPKREGNDTKMIVKLWFNKLYPTMRCYGSVWLNKNKRQEKYTKYFDVSFVLQ